MEHLDDVGGGFGIQRVLVRLGVIAQRIEPLAQRQHVGAAVADVQCVILRQLLLRIGEGNLVFDIRDGVAPDDREKRAHLALRDRDQLDGLHLTHQLGEHIALAVILALFDVQPQFAVLFNLADDGQGGVDGDFTKAGTGGLFAQVGTLDRADEARLVIGDFILYAARLRGRRGRFAARFGRGRRHGGRRGGRGGGRFGRGGGHGLEQLVEDIALAAALDAHIRPVFAVDLADGDDGQHAAFFQRFELVALFVGQFAQVGLLAGLKLAVFRLLVFGGGIFTKRDGGRQREQRRERAQTRGMLNRFHRVLSCAARAAHSRE